MKYLRNPVTSEVTYTTPLNAKRLTRYGWTYTTKAEWVEYKRAQLQLAITRHVTPARMAIH